MKRIFQHFKRNPSEAGRVSFNIYGKVKQDPREFFMDAKLSIDEARNLLSEYYANIPPNGKVQTVFQRACYIKGQLQLKPEASIKTNKQEPLKLDTLVMYTIDPQYLFDTRSRYKQFTNGEVKDEKVLQLNIAKALCSFDTYSQMVKFFKPHRKTDLIMSGTLHLVQVPFYRFSIGSGLYLTINAVDGSFRKLSQIKYQQLVDAVPGGLLAMSLNALLSGHQPQSYYVFPPAVNFTDSVIQIMHFQQFSGSFLSLGTFVDCAIMGIGFSWFQISYRIRHHCLNIVGRYANFSRFGLINNYTSSVIDLINDFSTRIQRPKVAFQVDKSQAARKVYRPVYKPVVQVPKPTIAPVIKPPIKIAKIHMDVDGYYKLFGLSGSELKVDEDALKTAYVEQVKLWHPDRLIRSSQKQKLEAVRRFKLLNKAKEVLLDNKEKKKLYDQKCVVEVKL